MERKDKIIVITLATLILICLGSAIAICVSYDNKIAQQSLVSETVSEKSDNWKMSGSGRYNSRKETVVTTEETNYTETEIETEETEKDTFTEETIIETTEETTEEETTTSTEEETTEVSEESETEEETSKVTTTVEQTTTEIITTVATTAVKISNPVPYSEPVDKSYFDDAIFIGDSIMEGMSVYKFFPENQVFASVGLNPYQLNKDAIDTYYGKVTALSAAVSSRPSKIYIMMGMNGVAWDMNADMTEQIGIFIDNLNQKIPGVKIYLMSVTPVSAEREAKPSTAEGKILNSQIDAFNKCLLKLADEKEIHYLDVNGSLRGSNGCLPSNMTSDGIHISKAVYQDIIDYMLSHTVS